MLAYWFLGLSSSLVACASPTGERSQLEQAVPGSAIPGNFPVPEYTTAQNPPTKQAFELGRSLFYDASLSRTGEVSCGSCHRQAAAFSDGGQRFSQGVLGHRGTRNSPALQNLRWKRELLWDGGANHIETMPLAPLSNHLEMGETLADVVRKLNASAEYRQRFAQLYGRQPIDSYQFLRALAQFTAALTSANSRYDRYMRQEAGGELSDGELRGLAVLRKNCAPCHAGELFTDESYRNNGLDHAFPLDSGRAHITGRRSDVGRFKVPSLRNIALTAPYMHDGRFKTLTEVLDHYDHGLAASPTLDTVFHQLQGPPGITLSAQQKQDLLAFLGTLTDETFLHDKRLAAPASHSTGTTALTAGVATGNSKSY
ncbi:cytochrome-c peroxidase [Hymenobacter taeanensis]|uniref:Cytochrome-c peroxidase n=1 Tax=Hymenobacter taeanensis TaxID=2735321 RepID=A0A6M6BIC6_9BACT|nr:MULTISPECIES: cytochrome c peroxidase [Hymenobacter]QJX47887.1 cytochrome-c peroxidase [Hymenobacter taeanensis]UOQ82671.1 cytochrome-c peroxidase [Hymenobacter sp. 5414T-23]